MDSWTFTLFVLTFQISFHVSNFTKIHELTNNLGDTFVCANSKSENKDGPAIEQSSYHTSEDKAFKNLKYQINDIKKQCGKLCETDLSTPIVVTNGKYYDHLKVAFNCQGLWNTSIFDEPSKFQHAPQNLPSYIKTEFSYKKQVPILSYYFDNLVEKERDMDNANWGK